MDQTSSSPRLTESEIRRWVGEASFERGLRYFQQGNIFNPRRQEQTLKARCLGSQPQPYYVEVALGPEGIAFGDCSCPVGAGGHCKHAAALLLTWLHEPQAFLEVEGLETALARRSPVELIALIRKMIQRYPDLETLLELPTIGGAGAEKPLDPEVIRRQVSNAFYGAGYEWGAVVSIAQDLQELVDLADDYAQREDWRNAATVYHTVAQGVLDHYGMVQDEEGDLHPIVNQCVEGLGQCLEVSEDPAQREGLLRALFDVYRWDVDFGGIDMGYQALDIILEQATPEERQRVAEWVRQALPTGDSWSDNYHRQVYGGFLLQLQEEKLDDDAFLRLCRETGRLQDLVNRLLELDRADEAMADVRQAGDYDLLRLADVFMSHGHADLAERLIRERAQTSQDSRLTVWLKERAQARGDLAEALSLAESLFWQRPSVPDYKEVRKLALSLGRWEALRAEYLSRLTDEGKYALLTEIHLLDGEVDQALTTVEQISGWDRWGRNTLVLQVAQAAEESWPRDAIRLYMAMVDRLINARGRDSYAQAATHLLRVRALYIHIGKEETGRSLIANIREQNRRLRALQDELNRAGL
jgi:uncharacterized Zn finger protein